MTFWIITAAMAVLVALLLAQAVLRAGDGKRDSRADYDLKVYRDQLAEVERDAARGVIAPDDAARVRTEISRRILTADAGRDEQANESRGPKRTIIGVFALGLIAGSMSLYSYLGAPGYGDLALADRIAFAEDVRANRPDQQTAQDGLPPAPPPEVLSPQYLELIETLRTTVAERPDDLQGHRLLAQNEANIGNFVAAAAAQKEVLRIKGDTADAGDLADYAELLVMAAGGYVSPEAETILRAVLVRDNEDARARYYIGLMMLQTGRPDVGLRLWDGLLRRGPEDAPWIEPIRAQIMAVAQLAGVDYAIPQIGSGDRPGPSASDIDAAAEMSAEERMEMIGGMVSGLSDRLATEGGPPADWARLITSLGVLGEAEQARAVFDNAMQVFEGDAGALDLIRAAGSQAGVAE